MNGADVVAKILKQEGIDVLIAYPVNPIIEAAARESRGGAWPACPSRTPPRPDRTCP